MKPSLIFVAVVLALCGTARMSPAAENVIFDTDIGSDIDDAGALAVLHALADLREIKILAIGVSHGGTNAVPYIHAVNAWYGRPDLPVGKVAGKAPVNGDMYLTKVAADFLARLPAKLRAAKTKKAAPEAASLYRKILAAQPDASVTLVTVGPATNIARLLNSGPDKFSPLTGVELVRKKVKFYGAGGNGSGRLPKGNGGFNYKQDVAAARIELMRMPVEVRMVFAGGSGGRINIGECLLKAPADHIIRRSYEAYFKGKKSRMNRPTWDQLRVLYACRPKCRKRFITSPAGDIRLGKPCRITWHKSPRGNKAYAYVRDFAAIRKQITDLMMRSRRVAAGR